jgi:hypothetical protein
LIARSSSVLDKEERDPPLCIAAIIEAGSHRRYL